MLTPEDIEFIELLIDERIAANKTKELIEKPRANTSKQYHTVSDIRSLIRKTLPEFKQWVGDQPFPIDLLRFFLSQRTNLLPDDLENTEDSKALPRFHRQVVHSIRNDHWPDCPFEPAGPRSYYQLVKQ